MKNTNKKPMVVQARGDKWIVKRQDGKVTVHKNLNKSEHF
jgi:hypothetical protein